MMMEDKLNEVFSRLRDAREVVYDCETSGLDWLRNFVCGHALAFGPAPSDSYYLPVRHGGGGNLFNAAGPSNEHDWNGVPTDWECELIKLLGRQSITLIGHNLGFDIKFLWRLGHRFNSKFEDTIINAPLLDEYQGKFSLEFCCSAAGVATKKTAEIQSHINQTFPETVGTRTFMGHYWRLQGDDPVAVSYAEGDGVSTWQLRDWQTPRLEAEGLTRVHDVESRLIPVLARMSIKGVRIDEERLVWLEGDLTRRIEIMLKEFSADFNVKSPSDVQRWCTDNNQIDWPLTQKRNAPSFPESWLETHEAGRKIVAIRKFRTLRDSFVTPLHTEHMFEGRVHTSYNQLRGDDYGTVSGRLSSSNPNLQQIPRSGSEVGELMKSVFIPDDGMFWASADMSQIEPRLLALYSGCKVLTEGYTSTPEIDAHTAVTIAINGERWHDMTPKQRKDARNVGKRSNQLILTGGGPNALSVKFGVPLADAKRIFGSYFERMPEVKRFQTDAARVLRNRGYVMTLLGRRCRLDDLDKSYKAVSKILQGNNADLIKISMVRIDEYLESEGRPIDLLNTVHDSIDFQFREEGRKHLDECLRLMTAFGPDDPIYIKMPLRVDVGEGRSWAEAGSK